MNASERVLKRIVPDGGPAGALFRETDWSLTALGAPETWPDALKTAVGIAFASRHPMLVLWGPELVQIYNEAFRPSLGEPGKVVPMGQPARAFWGETWKRVGVQVEAAYRDGVATFLEDTLVPVYRNGHVEDVYWTYGYSAIRNPDGAVGGVLVVCVETTQRITEAQRLRESRRALEDFLMRAPVGMCLLEGPQHVFALVNPEFMRLLFGGRPAEDLLGKPLMGALPGIEGQGFKQILDSVFESGRGFVGAKMRACLVQKDGREKELFVNFAYEAMRDAEKRIVGVLAVVYEVTDQVNEEKETRRLAENLTAAITARDTFLGIASHELKTPLTALKLQSQTNLRTLSRSGAQSYDSEKLRRVFESVNLQADRLTRLVEDMLDVYRINAGKLSMDFARADLSAAVVDVVERFSPQFEARGGSVLLSVEPGVEAEVDLFRFEQVLTNLLTNALKYAPGTAVEVTLQGYTTVVQLAVRDEGPGIPADKVGHVFERFVRADREDGAGGLGLGLYISREIVLAHHGVLRVESEPGRGSRFVVVLPRAR